MLTSREKDRPKDTIYLSLHEEVKFRYIFSINQNSAICSIKFRNSPNETCKQRSTAYWLVLDEVRHSIAIDSAVLFLNGWPNCLRLHRKNFFKRMVTVYRN